MLPILHLNGYKIANPTVLARIPRERAARPCMEGYGHKPYFVEGDDPASVHQQLAATLDTVVEEIHAIQKAAREGGVTERPTWPMIVLRTPKGWTGPKEIDGKPVEGTWRSHQVPMGEVRTNAEHRQILETWMRSYRPEELFDDDGVAVPGARRAGAQELPADEREPRRERRRAAPRPAPARLPRLRRRRPGAGRHARPRRRASSGTYLRDVTDRNRETFRMFGPDETQSNRLGAVFEVTDRQFDAEILPTDEFQAPEGRVMEVLSEHQCQGWLEGYLLTGPARPLQLLRGVHPHRRLDVQPAREVAQGHARHPVAPADRVAQLRAQLARLAPGPQRLQPPGPGLHRPRREQEGGRHPRLPAAGRQHAAVRGRPLPAQPATTST